MRCTLVVLLLSPLVFAQDAGQQTQQLAVQQAQQAQQIANQQTQQAERDTNRAAQETMDANSRANQQMTDAASVAANTQGGNVPKLAVTRTPRFSPKPGTFKGGTPQVTITVATKGAAIHYTTDGSAPTLASERYTGPVPLSQTTTLKAIAVAASGQSAIAQGKYIIK